VVFAQFRKTAGLGDGISKLYYVQYRVSGILKSSFSLKLKCRGLHIDDFFPNFYINATLRESILKSSITKIRENEKT